MSANDIQHGGDHYKTSDYQHWDWTADVDLNPYTYQATKYVSRWPKKDGIVGIKKAGHYIEKLIELIQEGRGDRYVRENMPTMQIAEFTAKFIHENSFGELEARVFWAAAMWRTVPDLVELLGLLDDLREHAEASEQARGGKAVAKVACAMPTPPSEALGGGRTCPACGGTGRPLYQQAPCERCDGFGTLQRVEPGDECFVAENCVIAGWDMKGKRVRVLDFERNTLRAVVETMYASEATQFTIAVANLEPCNEPARDETGS